MVLDLVRLFCVTLLGALFAYVVQPWLFQSGIIALTDVDVEDWLAQKYMIGVSIVFAVSILTAILWFLIAFLSKATEAKDVARVRPIWGFLLLLPVLSIIAAIYFFNGSNDALLWITALYIFDMVLCYWFATALSSPGLLKYVPPFAYFLRNLVRIK